MTSIVNFYFNSEPAKQILATQCPAYVSSSGQHSLRVEEGEYKLVKSIFLLNQSVTNLIHAVFYFIFCYFLFVCLFVCFITKVNGSYI